MGTVVLCVNLLPMLHNLCKFFLGLVLIGACNSVQDADNQLVTTFYSTTVRAKPSEKSAEIVTLKNGATLLDLQKVSPFESQMVVSDQVFQSPWLAVRTKDKQIGWVPAWCVKPILAQPDWLLQKRLEAYFGAGIRQRRNDLEHRVLAAQSAAELAEVWSLSIALRDTMMALLSRRPVPNFQPDFTWMESALPGYIVQKVSVSERPYLFADFSFWRKKALETNGLEDDLFFDFTGFIFPNDGIESFYPVWKFQLSESRAASQLGLGRHLSALQKLDTLWALAPGFAGSLQGYKGQILEDIFDKSVEYWQPSDKIVAELQACMEAAPKCLSATEQNALAIRQKMFEDPEANQIRVNLRSGE